MRAVFATLDVLERLLGERRYLAGSPAPTEAEFEQPHGREMLNA